MQILERIPPMVQTDLHKGQSRQSPHAMPFEKFVAEAMRGLDSELEEVTVGLAKVLKTGSHIVQWRFLKIVNAKRD